MDTLISSGKDTIEVPKNHPKKIFKGTTITVSGLHKPINLEKFNTICLELTEIYQTFTRDIDSPVTIEASYDGGVPRSLKYVEPDSADVLRSRTYKLSGKTLTLSGAEQDWYLPLNFYYLGHNVTGHLEIRTKGSYKDNPGIVLYRYGRVIRGLKNKPYIPQKIYKTANKYSKQRVYGELNMDGLPVSYMKDGFNIDEEDFLNHILQIPGVDELMRQAENYRKDFVGLTVIDSDVSSQPNNSKDKTTSTKDSGKTGTKNSTKEGAKGDANAQRPSPKPPQATTTPSATSDINSTITLLESLQSKTEILALKSIIEETIRLYRSCRYIGASLCLRVILECGCLHKIRTKFPNEYSNVADLGIQALITYLNKNISQLLKQNPQGKIFHFKDDHTVIKCIQGNIAGGNQTDILLLNNISHGHFQPTKPTLDKVVLNIQALLEWAYSK